MCLSQDYMQKEKKETTSTWILLTGLYNLYYNQSLELLK